MAVGGTPTKNESSTSPEAEGEAYTTFGYEEGKCLVSYGPREDDDMRMGDHQLWLLDTGASGHFTYDASQFRDYVECKRVLRYAGGNTYPIVGMGSFMLCF